jgi:superfamily II DNA or RNA helicase
MLASGIIHQSQSWEQFRSAVTALATTKAKGDAFEGLCAAFLRTDPRYVAELKSVWLRHEVPAAIAKRLNLPSSDEGIDGIAETHGGEFWSLQCKFLSNHKSTLTKNALDGFAHLSFTHCKGITKALVLHTSSAPIRKHKLLGVSEIGLREFEGLDEAAWAAIRGAASSTRPRAVTHKPRKPRPHQEAAVAAVTAHLQTHDRGRVLMACGSGKSLVGFWVQAAMGAKQVVVAVPSLSLLNQTLKEWATEWAARGETVRYTAVCGDESAADIGDSFVEHAYELGIDTYTDEARIAERLKALRGEHHVVFTTYQSSHRLAAAARRAKHTFDLGILDEAHKTVGERGGRFTTLLHPKVAIRKRIAMTATERVLKGSEDRVLSMDDPKVYGEVAFSYTFKQAIADGVICDYKVITLAVSESRMRELIASNKHLKLHGRGKEDRLRLAQDLAAGELLAKAQSEHGVRHAISFHRSITAASGFADQWESVDRMVKRRVHSTAFHVSSKVPTGRRVELLREFRESPSAVITNARCLTEGVDVPNVDAVLFADPRRSMIDIVQAVGRTLRKNPKNPEKIGYVLLPVLVEDGQTVDEFLESSAFKEVGRVLAVLSTHDERIAEEFRAVEGGGQRSPRESRIVFSGDVPVGVRLSAEEFAARCGARVWQRVAKVNWRPFEEAREWVRGLGLRGAEEWHEYCAKGIPGKPPRPSDVPANPKRVYADHGWNRMGDWLGTGTVATHQRVYRALPEARHFVRSLGLKCHRDWRDYCAGRFKNKPALPADVPRAPHHQYRDQGWIGYGDWLGSGNLGTRNRDWRDFAEARQFVHSLNLRGFKEWQAYCRGDLPDLPKRPMGIPTTPPRTYADSGWKGWEDWLGLEVRHFRSFEDARSFARSLGLANSRLWKDYAAGRVLLKGMPPFPNDVPKNPSGFYSERGWCGWIDWLGNDWRPFAEARAWARGLGLASQTEWRDYCAGRLEGKPPKPSDIPLAPSKVYRGGGWIGWGDWVGNGRKPLGDDWRPFAEARAWARGLGLASQTEWRDYCAGRLEGKPPKPADIPSNPYTTYKHEGWISWGDWVGTGTVHGSKRIYRSFAEARAWVRGLGLRSGSEWNDYCAGRLEGKPPKPVDIPIHPYAVYKDDGWVGIGDWLGNGRKPRKPKSRKP